VHPAAGRGAGRSEPRLLAHIPDRQRSSRRFAVDPLVQRGEIVLVDELAPARAAVRNSFAFRRRSPATTLRAIPNNQATGSPRLRR
jgi:hypothetical protein